MLLEKLMEVAEQFPDDFALLSEKEKVTWRELMELSRRAAHKLSRLEIGKGDFVTVELPRGRNYVAAALSAWMVNAAFAALDSTYPPRPPGIYSERLRGKAPDLGFFLRKHRGRASPFGGFSSR